MTNFVQETENINPARGNGLVPTKSGSNNAIYRLPLGSSQRVASVLVDSETGNIDIRATDGTSFIKIDAKNKKAYFGDTDVVKGIADAQETADGAAAVALNDIILNGLTLQHGIKITTREDKQLLINGKVFKGEKGEPGKDGEQGPRGPEGPRGPRGENAPGVEDDIRKIKETLDSHTTDQKKFKQDNLKSHENREICYHHLSDTRNKGRCVLLNLDFEVQTNQIPVNDHGFDLLVTREAGNGKEKYLYSKSLRVRSMSDEFNLTFFDPDPSDNRTYRAYIKPALRADVRADINGKFTALVM